MRLSKTHLLLLVLSVFNLLSPLFSIAQENTGIENKTSLKHKSYPTDRSSLGLGMGLDYGGFGACLTIYPQKNIGLFGGLGYALTGVGYNAGIKARLLFNKKKPNVSLFVLGMYGYNTVFKIKGLSKLNKTFYGPSVGVGLETAVRPNKVGVWSFAIIVPLRSKEALDYQDYLSSIPYVNMENKLAPLAFSIGYKFIIH
ncbi:MAG: hypothetical protein V4561_10630 [Bacteroidota bacterium]